MKVLITGATGLIGTQITKLLLEQGIHVNYLTTREEKIKHEHNHKGFLWSPKKGEIDVACFENVGSVINLVGASISERWTKSYKKIILESRTETANLLYTTLQRIDHNVRHFISASGISIYPNDETHLYTEESTEVDKGFLGEVVVAWEAAADQFATLGIDVAKVRTGVVFAKKEGAFPELLKPVRLGVPAPLGSGKQWISWIHIDDIAAVYVYVLNKSLVGVYNAVAPTAVNNKKLTRLLANTLNVPMFLPNVPGFMLKLVLGEMAVLVLEGQLVSSQKLEKHGFIFRYYNAENAVKNLLKK
ncbi:TIGR01777 family oxidoreductase [Patiriisocius marinus]|uniref:NAD-dependent epimerase n=1 Tax=Patiriisocius marinus TaxID=1397112 RepID=A0A5J4J1T7_9FLAO|nr:TIGR01777 family oxidoreductase [Patiriisocius marinus]GER59751.1 NAD-dependent epimerase [Patiriisocius marinus]